MNPVFCVISHTHWDREWYLPFEQMRLRLLDLMDHLLALLDEEPGYIFHLDAQTVVLEDYLEIRPEREETLRSYIAQGRIRVGPWYVQNDFYLTAGESTVRNLMLGMQTAERYGGCDRVGYAPDQFGNCAQLPQLLAGMGIDSFIFGRGCPQSRGAGRPMPTEFLWEGSDGTSCLAINLRDWYNNAQRFSENIDYALGQLDRIENKLCGVVTTPYYLLMNGVDHLEAQENLFPILKRIQARRPDARLKQTTLEQYVKDVRRYHTDNRTELARWRGELRCGDDSSVLVNTLSSRVYVKQANDRCENRLYHRVEPLYAMLAAAGGGREIYPAAMIRHILKDLIKNHAHDSICGCSADSVSRHMLDRYERIAEVEEDLTARALELIGEHAVPPQARQEDYLLTLVNPALAPFTGRMEARLTFPCADRVRGFKLLTPAGEELPFSVLRRSKANIKILDPINLPGIVSCDAYEIEFTAADLPPAGVRTLIVRKTGGVCRPAPASAAASPALENRFLRVEADARGRVRILDKETGVWLEDALWLEDTADYGSSYIFTGDPDERPVTSADAPAQVAALPGSPLRQAMRIAFRLRLPREIAGRTRRARSKRLCTCSAALTLSLDADAREVAVSYAIDNRAKDHRLRLLFRTGLEGDDSYALAPFDLVRRVRGADYEPGKRVADQPFCGFVGLHGQGRTVGIWAGGIQAAGLHEYEHMARPGGQLAVTLVRANQYISLTNGFENVSEDWTIPENQCLRTLSGELRLCFAPGGPAALAAALLNRQAAPCCRFGAADWGKLHGGRPVVQDSDIDEIFRRPDAYPGLKYKDEWSLMSLHGDSVAVSALKRAEDGGGLILRLVSLQDEPAEVRVEIPRLHSASLVSLDERRELRPLAAGEGGITLTLRGKEIAAVRLLIDGCV